MKNLLKNIFAIFLGVLFLEISLHIVSYTYKYYRSYSSKNISDNKIKIICLGESTTYLGGMNSYPNILQRKLDNKYPNVFQIINLGLPAQTTTQIKHVLEENIHRIAPSLALLMMGINDSSNLDKLNNDERERSFSSHSKLIELFSNFFKMNKKLSQTELLFRDFKYSEIIKFVNKKNKPSKLDLDLFIKSVLISNNPILILNKLKRIESFSLLESSLDELLLYNEGNGFKENHLIQRILFEYISKNKDKDQSKAFFKRYIEHTLFWTKESHSPISPQKITSLKERLHSFRLEDKFEIIQLLNSIEVNQRENDIAPDSILSEHNKVLINEKSIKNYRSILEILENYGTTPLLIQYPMREPKELSQYFNREGLIIGNKKNFINARKSYSFKDLFVDNFATNFGHFSPLGANILSDAIIKKIDFLCSDKQIKCSR